MARPQLKLVLENGTEFLGESFGYYPEQKSLIGEVVFNTGMTGYQEIFSDPSYYGQILTMTYPLIGNYGVNKDDFESLKPVLRGLVVKEYCEHPSNFRKTQTLEQFLIDYHIPAIAGIDTRKLTKIIRPHGSMKGFFVDPKTDASGIKNLFKENLPIDHVDQVSVKKAIQHHGKGERIVLMDFGYKAGILKALTKRDCEVIVVPYNMTFNEIQKYRPDGILLSNGPGDPKVVTESIKTVSELQEATYPMMGICLGHQVLALANGADTYKLKFGHRGANHPVKDLVTEKTYLTAQNHGYAVVEESVKKTKLKTFQINLNDGSVEGLKHSTLPVFSVQYHPEASSGPEDTGFLFDEFLQMIKKNKRGSHA